MLQITTKVEGEFFSKDRQLFEATLELETLRPLVLKGNDEGATESYLKAEEKYIELISEVVKASNKIVVTRTSGQLTWILVCDRKKEDTGGYFFPDWPEMDEMQAEGIDTLVGESIEIKPTLNADFSDPLEHLDFYDFELVSLNEMPKIYGGGQNGLLNDLKELKLIFDRIAGVSSINEKIKIIQENKNNKLLISVLSFVYDDFVKTGMSFSALSKYKDKQNVAITDYQGDYSLASLMSYVKEHNTGTLSTMQLIIDFGKALPNDLTEFVYRIFSKELKIGITAKTINKALGQNFIKQFAVQLAYPYHKYLDKIKGQEFILTQKLDGHRAICIVDHGKATFYTRKGLIVDGLNNQAMNALNLVKNGFCRRSMVLDGELLLSNDQNLETKDLFRATSRILRSQTADKSNIIFNIFDALPVKEFKDGESLEPFIIRKERLRQAFINVHDMDYDGDKTEYKSLKLVKNLYQGPNIAAIRNLQKTFVEPLGWEGLMLNLAGGKYVTKRTKDLLKIKEFYDADVPVKSVFEGTGKLKGTLGGIVVDYKGYEIKVGSGFTDADRDYYWSNPDKIIGKIVDVNYFEETHNQNNDDISLRFPTFVCVRESKTIDDISYEV